MGACASSRETKEREAALIGVPLSRARDPNVVAVVKAAFLHAHFAAERHVVDELARAENDGAAAAALDARAHAATLALWQGVSGAKKKQLIARGFDVLHEVEEHEFGIALWARLTVEERSEAFHEAMCVDIELEKREAASSDGTAAAARAPRDAGEAPEATAAERMPRTLPSQPTTRAGAEDVKHADDARLREMRALHAEVVAATRRASCAAATPWTRFIAEESGHYYYTHQETGESVWLLPVGATALDGEAEHTPLVAADAAEGSDAATDASLLLATAASNDIASGATAGGVVASRDGTAAVAPTPGAAGRRRNSMAQFEAALGAVDAFHSRNGSDGASGAAVVGDVAPLPTVPRACEGESPPRVFQHALETAAAERRMAAAAAAAAADATAAAAAAQMSAATANPAAAAAMDSATGSAPPAVAAAGAATSATLLNALKVRLRARGVKAVFDTLKGYDDGDGELSYSEFEEGLFSVAGWSGGGDGAGNKGGGSGAGDPGEASTASRRALAHSLFDAFDADGGGSVNMRELAGGLTPLCSDPDDVEATCRCIFELYDDDGSGELSADEMEQCVRTAHSWRMCAAAAVATFPCALSRSLALSTDCKGMCCRCLQVSMQFEQKQRGRAPLLRRRVPQQRMRRRRRSRRRSAASLRQ